MVATSSSPASAEKVEEANSNISAEDECEEELPPVLPEKADEETPKISGEDGREEDPAPLSRWISNEPAPDGGLHAWLSCLGAGLLIMTSWGLVQSFGTFQSFYSTHYLASHSASDISWIGTVQAFLMPFTGILTGAIFDRGHLRALLIAGDVLIVFGWFMLSISTKYWQILLAQGICTGLGGGIMFTPALAQVAVNFDRRRPIALALTTAGVGIGGIVWPIMLSKLIPQLGFAWATRVVAFIALGCLLFASLILGWRKTPKKPPRSLFDLSALHEPPFVVYAVATFLMFTAYWIPWFYIPLYAQFATGASASLSFYLLSITNAVSIFGRLITSVLQRWASPMYLQCGAGLIASILVWSWLSIHELGNFIAFSVLWGLFSGPFAVLPTNVVVSVLSPSTRVVGARMGMIWAMSALGALVGSPIASAASDPTNGRFLGAQAYAGACMMAGVVLVGVAAALLRARDRKKNAMREQSP